MQYISKNQTDTISYGKQIASQLFGGDILLLQGDLGAGKTILVKGISEGLGIKKEITSPTFSLMNVYNIKANSKQPIVNNKLTKMQDLKQAKRSNKRSDRTITTLVHIDTYRLENEKELIEIGIEDYLGQSNTVCLIEWPEKIIGLLANRRVMVVKIEHSDNNKRKISSYNM